MKESIQILVFILAVAAAFLLGWRVMPRLWRKRGKRVLSALHLRRVRGPEREPEPYLPKSTRAFGDEIGAGDSLIYYFYKDYCPHCRTLEPLTAGLPQKITLPDGTSSAVCLVCLSKSWEDTARIIADYCETHGVPKERQFVPAVVIGNRYLLGENEIVPQLMDALAGGEGLKTPLLNGTERLGG